MKRILVIVLAIVFAFTFFGCRRVRKKAKVKRPRERP